MEENNNQEFKTTYKVVEYGDKQKAKSSFSKTVFVPFVSGVLGAALVVGTCFGVPGIKEKLLNDKKTSVLTSSRNSL